MMLRQTAPWLVAALVLGLLPTSCGDPADPDCFTLCRNYDDCVGEVDLDACVTNCQFEVGLFESQARQCERCIDGLSCPEQASCWAPRGDCVDFVAFVARNGRFTTDDNSSAVEDAGESGENDD
jgi:hypothetical protein